MVAKSLYRSVDLINAVNKVIIANQLMKPNDRLLLSISGGQDSICLLVLFNQFYTQMELDLNLLWCHHLWQFDSFSLMRQITKLSFLFQFNSCFAITSKFVPSELLARNWRQNCSYRLCLFYNYCKIILAHSASDKAETILLNFLRGTGLTGLSPLHWTKQINEKSFKKEFGTNLQSGEHISQIVTSVSSLHMIKGCASSLRASKMQNRLCVFCPSDTREDAEQKAQQPVPFFYWLSFDFIRLIKQKKDTKEKKGTIFHFPPLVANIPIFTLCAPLHMQLFTSSLHKAPTVQRCTYNLCTVDTLCKDTGKNTKQKRFICLLCTIETETRTKKKKNLLVLYYESSLHLLCVHRRCKAGAPCVASSLHLGLCIFFAHASLMQVVHLFCTSGTDKAKQMQNTQRIRGKKGTRLCVPLCTFAPTVHCALSKEDAKLFFKNSLLCLLDKAFFKKPLKGVPFDCAGKKTAKYSKKWFNVVSYAFFKVCFISIEQNKQYPKKTMCQKTEGLEDLELNQIPLSYIQSKIRIPQDTFWFYRSI